MELPPGSVYARFVQTGPVTYIRSASLRPGDLWYGIKSEIEVPQMEVTLEWQLAGRPITVYSVWESFQ